MTITDAMVEAACDAIYARTDIVLCNDTMRAALEAAARFNIAPEPGLRYGDKVTRLADGTEIRHLEWPAIEKIRVALEKARRLHNIDCADHNIGMFIDEALSWLPQKPSDDDTHGFVDGEKNL